jgi:5-methylcytosine-specific restriction endonuclease McrA
MKRPADRTIEIFERTDGRCHLCSKPLALSNYGRLGRRGSWEVDHSKPRARGGTDRLSNLLPACPACARRTIVTTKIGAS